MIVKTFKHKGQMINYYNKLRRNMAIGFIMIGYFDKLGYAIQYSYKEDKKSTTNKR